ncbi:Rieske (2Fe-2S) protein [Halomarina litorea]|uniref:Rieske (2Fe-2S) protein n=1 Tax=Halomarina litorea TaxID=2961595 RepID=UPI0020C377D1|nr:Rieske (2Fe-2S) protein [Halomarina sp. BCD28]
MVWTTRLTAVEGVPENRSYRFTVREADGSEEVVILVTRTDPLCDPEGEDPRPVAAWRNYCQYETDQRLDRGFGAVVRDVLETLVKSREPTRTKGSGGGEIVCPKHGSMLDACSGHCDNGKAAGSTLVGVNVAVEDGVVYLPDRTVEFLHEGGIEDDDGPSSTSHLSL